MTFRPTGRAARGPADRTGAARVAAGAAESRRRGLAPALLAAIAAAAGPAHGSAQGAPPDPGPNELLPAPLVPGGRIGELELQAPPAERFVLRGTLPVPPGFFPRPDGALPIAVVEPDGAHVPAQVEVVSRYADDAQGADVVEVLARVRRDPAVAAGTPIRYPLVYSTSPPPPDPGDADVRDLFLATDDVPSSVADLLSSPDNLVVGAHDALGHAYALRPLDTANRAGFSRYGRAQTQLRIYGTMEPLLPVAGPAGTLPHLFGVHVYLSAVAGEEVLLLDVRFNNGPDGLDPDDESDDPLGRVYFDSVWIALPAGWTVHQAHPDPFFGGVPQPGPVSGKGLELVRYDVVRPIVGGTKHVMPAQGQFHRRLAIAPAGRDADAQRLLERRGVGFARRGADPVDGRPHWSWWNAETARYFPQRHFLPALDHVGAGAIRSILRKEYRALRKDVGGGDFTGVYPLVVGQLGWARPYGVAYGGMTGGNEIHVFQGLRTVEAASNDGYRQLELVHRMHCDRQRNVLYDRGGQPTQLQEWLREGPQGKYFPGFFYMTAGQMTADPFGYHHAETAQVQLVRQLGLEPAYQSQLLAFEPIDLQHLIRNTRNAKALVWLGNDPLAKDDLWMQAELVRLSYHPYANGKHGQVQSTGMAHDIAHVLAHPGKGFTFGRGEGWGIDTLNAVYAFAGEGWRRGVRSWYDTLVELVVDGQAACTGFLQSNVSHKMLDGQFRARQAIEQAILENALRGALETVYRGADPTYAAMLEDVLRASYASWLSPLAWSAHHDGAWAVSAVGPLQLAAPLYCAVLPPGGHSGGVDTYQNPSSMAYGFELTGDVEFLVRAAKMVGGGGGDLLAVLEQDGLENLVNRAALLALAQAIDADL